MEEEKISVDGWSENLAIVAEKRSARKGGGCVGVLVQFYEWNRRLAKRKFFSRKLLASDRSPKSVSKNSRGDKAASSKPLMIGDEKNIKPDVINRSSISIYDKDKSGSPGLVARLMGLDSMPATSRHYKPRKFTNGVLKFEPESQKSKKTSLFDRRKSNHRLVSSNKDPKIPGRKSSTRLMEAASKILEPGLQSRNRSRYSLLRSSPLTEEKSSVCPKFLGSCHGCGNLVEVQHGDSSSSSSSSYSSSNLSSFSSHIGCSRERERERERSTSAPVEFNRSIQRDAYPSAASSSSSLGKSSHCRARSSKAMDIHVSKNRSSNFDYENFTRPPCTKKFPDVTSPRSGVPWARRKVPESAFLSEASSETESRGGDPLSRQLLEQRIDSLSILLGQKIRELTSPDPDSSTSTAAVVLQELIAALSAAVTPPRSNNPQFLSKKSNFPAKPRFQEEVNVRNLRHPSLGVFEHESPMSVLESSLYENCLSESFNSSSGQRAQGRIPACSIDDSHSWDVDTDLSDSGKSTSIRVPQGSNTSYTWGVISRVEVLFKDICPIILLILQTFETSPHDPRIRRLLFDSIIEHLETKYSSFDSVGFWSWLKLPSLGLKELRLELCNKIKAYGSYPRKGQTLARMMEEDMEGANTRWCDFHVEVFEWGVDLEDNILRTLINEIVFDLRPKRVRKSDLSYFY